MLGRAVIELYQRFDAKLRRAPAFADSLTGLPVPSRLERVEPMPTERLSMRLVRDLLRLRDEPLIVLLAADHRLAAKSAIRPDDIAGEALVGVPYTESPVLRTLTDAYGAKLCIDLSPDHLVDTLSGTMSLVASTGGIALMPLYAQNLLPPTVVSRPLAVVSPTMGLSLGYNEANASPLLKSIISKIGELTFA